MAWVEPQYTPQQVDAAGMALVRFLAGTETADDVRSTDYHINVINNWRVSHNYPLNTFQVNLRSSAKRIDKDALVAQRIKRFFRSAQNSNKNHE